MKRLVCFILCLIVLLTAVGSLPASALTDLVNCSHDDLPLYNAVANVQMIGGDQAIDTISGDNAPGIVMVNAGDVADMTALLSACVEHHVIPVVNITDIAQIDTVIEARKQAACTDMTIVSDNTVVLYNIRRKHYTIRTGLICDLDSDTLTSEQAGALRSAVRGAPATFCVLKSEDASRQAVAELQELAVAVWVQVDTPAADTAFAADALRAVTSGANGIITDNAAAFAAILNEYLKENTMTRTPVLIGHRGNPTQAPENSLSGFITAYENGADIVEIDVDITADGEIIIMHDSTLNRTTDYTGTATVGQMTLEEVKACRLLGLDGKVTDEQVPTLRELLEEFQDKDCRIFVEFKGSNAYNVQKTAAIIKEYGMEHRVDVISFNTNLLTNTQSAMTGMSTGYLTSTSGVVNNYASAVITLDAPLTSAQTVKSTLNINKSIFNNYFMQVVTDRGMTAWPWTFSAQSNNIAFLTCPDGLTTDDVQWAKDMVKYVDATVAAPVIKAGTSTDIAVSAVTYGGNSTSLAADDMIVKVIDGDENITLDGTHVTAVKNGTATVLYGYETTTADGSPYVLYAQPITITVGEPTVKETTDNHTDLIVIIAVIAAGVLVIVAAAVLIKPQKKVE